MDANRLHSEQNWVRTGSTERYEPPTIEVISLDCEITSYAPDGDGPLF